MEYKVYVRADAAGRIIEINSSAFLQNATGWVQVDEGTGDHYHHAQGNYFPTPLRDDRGICRYKLVDSKAAERTQAEMDADAEALPAPAQTESERLRAWQEEIEAALIELASMSVKE